MQRWLDAAERYRNNEPPDLEYPECTTLTGFLESDSGKAAVQLLAATRHRIELRTQILGYSNKTRGLKRPLVLVLDGSGLGLVPEFGGIASALYDARQSHLMTQPRSVSTHIAACFLNHHKEDEERVLSKIYDELDELWCHAP